MSDHWAELPATVALHEGGAFQRTTPQSGRAQSSPSTEIRTRADVTVGAIETTARESATMRRHEVRIARFEKANEVLPQLVR